MDFCFHYLDDYFFVEPPQAPTLALDTAMQVLSNLGIPMAPEKVDGPATTLAFLGIELDGHTLTARLPADKLQRPKTMVSEWRDQKSCIKRELVSWTLQHVTMVIRFGRVFLCQMIELAQTASEYHHFLRLNRAFRSDLQWWCMALPRWNGTGFLPQPSRPAQISRCTQMHRGHGALEHGVNHPINGFRVAGQRPGAA